MVLREELERHARFHGQLPEHLEVHTCSFQGYVQRRTSGPNWLMVGESAAMIDPLTSNGFTASLRFGAHAARLIEETIELPAIPASERRLYDGCLRSTASAFNRHIERTAYEPELRERLGTERATLVYVLFGYLANAAYQKLRPRGFISWRLLCLVLGLFELWFRAWSLVARLRPARPSAPGALRVPPPERPGPSPHEAVEAPASVLPARSGAPSTARPRAPR